MAQESKYHQRLSIVAHNLITGVKHSLSYSKEIKVQIDQELQSAETTAFTFVIKVQFYVTIVTVL